MFVKYCVGSSRLILHLHDDGTMEEGHSIA